MLRTLSFLFTVLAQKFNRKRDARLKCFVGGFQTIILLLGGRITIVKCVTAIRPAKEAGDQDHFFCSPT